jgi:nicotinamide-nucleotide amidase
MINAEIVGVGTELLLGQIANTNAQKISRSLAEIGVNVFFHSVVGDNLERIRVALEQAMERSDVVIVTGGLGPTPDDLTRDAVAAALGVDLKRDESLADTIRSIFERLRREMPEDNLRQADLPAGATPIQPEGTAPGFIVEARGSVLFALPGVPWEMMAMMDKTVIPMLERRGGEGVIESKQILVIGLGESHTNQKIADIVKSQTNPTIAFLAGHGQVRVRITARAESTEAALALIDPVERAIRERLGRAAVPGNHASIAEALSSAARDAGLKVAVAESLTGGLLAAALTEAEGASDFFVGSLVAYTNEAKEVVAEVDGGILDGPGAVSEEAARALAESAARLYGADLGLSATGVAGPTEQEDKPVGTIYVGASYKGRTEVRFVQGYGDRENVRRFAVTAALDLGRRLVLRD